MSDIVTVNKELISRYKMLLRMDNFTDNEITIFHEFATAMGLNPFTKDIYAIKDGKDRIIYHPSIDAMRKLAEKTGNYAGQTAPLFCDHEGNWHEAWLDETRPPVACKVGVYRKDCEYPTYYTAMYREYFRKSGNPDFNNWIQKPCVMLSKCAEACALRKAFPNIGQLHIQEEVDYTEVKRVHKPTHLAPVKSVVSHEYGNTAEEAMEYLTELGCTRKINAIQRYSNLSEYDALKKLLMDVRGRPIKVIEDTIKVVEKLELLETENKEETENLEILENEE